MGKCQFHIFQIIHYSLCHLILTSQLYATITYYFAINANNMTIKKEKDFLWFDWSHINIP